MMAGMGDRDRRVELHLLRHADAGDPEAWTRPDAERPLSPKGRRQAERLGRHLALLGFTPDAIVSSPRVRATETAEIVAALLGSTVRIDPRLGGPLDPSTVEAIIDDAGNPRRPVLVGHDPDFSALAAKLLGIGELPVRKGAIVRIDLDRPIGRSLGTLRWLLPPDAIPEATGADRG